MNGAAYWIFMNHEATWPVPLFHLKLILTATWPTVLHTMESVTTLKANFSAMLKKRFTFCSTQSELFSKGNQGLIHHNCLQALMFVNKFEGEKKTASLMEYERFSQCTMQSIWTSTETSAPLLSTITLTDSIILWQKKGPLAKCPFVILIQFSLFFPLLGTLFVKPLLAGLLRPS